MAFGGLKAFQGLEGQWKGLSFTASAVSVAEVGLEVVVSSSDDSSLAVVDDGGGGGGGGGAAEAVEGTSNRKFLSGDQPGGRRLLFICRTR